MVKNTGLYEQIMAYNKPYYKRFSNNELSNFIDELSHTKSKSKSYDSLFYIGETGMRYYTAVLNNDKDALVDLYVEGKIKVLHMLAEISKKYDIDLAILESITNKYTYARPGYGKYEIEWTLHNSSKELETDMFRYESLMLALTKEDKWVTYKKISYDNPYQPIEIEDWVENITLDEIKEKYL